MQIILAFGDGTIRPKNFRDAKEIAACWLSQPPTRHASAQIFFPPFVLPPGGRLSRNAPSNFHLVVRGCMHAWIPTTKS